MSAIYPKAKEQFLLGALNLASATVSAALIKTTYTYNAADVNVTAALAQQAGSSVVLSTQSVSADGIFDAADITFTAVAAGSTVNAVLIYSGTTPIAYIDSGVGFPFATSGADVTVSFSNSADKIFRL